jgi:DNA-binding NtrC family response regulator
MSLCPVLIIDDDPLVLKTLASMLRLRQQVEVEISDSTVGALERVRATDYAALICDANQSRLPGLSFVRAVRKLRPDTPVLLMMDQGDQDAGHQAMEAGAYDVLAKPIDEETFLLAVNRALEAFQLRRQVRDQDSKMLAALEEVLGDLEVLYRAFGLRGHFEAIMARAKAEEDFKVSAPTTTFAAKGGRQAIGPRDRNTPLPSES